MLQHVERANGGLRRSGGERSLLRLHGWRAQRARSRERQQPRGRSGLATSSPSGSTATAARSFGRTCGRVLHSCVDGSGKCRDADRQRDRPRQLVGLNTRFGDYSGGGGELATDYPPFDVVTSEPSPNLEVQLDTTNVITQGSTTVTQSSQINFNYANYQQKCSQQGPTTTQPATERTGAAGRRILTVLIADCTGFEQRQLATASAGLRVLLCCMEGSTARATTTTSTASSSKGCTAKATPGSTPSLCAGTSPHPALQRRGEHAFMRRRTSSVPPRDAWGGDRSKRPSHCRCSSVPDAQATVELSRAFIQYTVLSDAVRDAARYAAGRALFGTTQKVTISTALITETRNLAVYGHMAGTGTCGASGAHSAVSR